MSSVKNRSISMTYAVADEVGFEPTEPFGSLVFKTSAFNRSATHPSPEFGTGAFKHSTACPVTPHSFVHAILKARGALKSACAAGGGLFLPSASG